MLEQRLKALRKEHGYTLKELSTLLSLSESVISLYENGKRQPSYDILIKFSKLYEVTTDYLLCIGSNQEDIGTVKRTTIDDSLELVQRSPFTLTNDDIKQIKDFTLFIKNKRNL